MLISPLAGDWRRQHIVIVIPHDVSRGPGIGGKRFGKGWIESEGLLVKLQRFP